MRAQISLFDEKVTMLSIDARKNRYRAYEIELKKIGKSCLIKKWGRVKKKGDNWMLINNKWQQEIEIGKDIDETKLEKLYQRILKTRKQNGYSYYLGTLFV